jgi:hypothetical protein
VVVAWFWFFLSLSFLFCFPLLQRVVPVQESARPLYVTFLDTLKMPLPTHDAITPTPSSAGLSMNLSRISQEPAVTHKGRRPTTWSVEHAHTQWRTMKCHRSSGNGNEGATVSQRESR